MYKIIQKRKLWYWLSGSLVTLSILALSLWGLNFGIDFTGGSLVQLKFNYPRPTNAVLEQALANLKLPALSLQPVDQNELIIKTVSLSEEQHQVLLQKINALYPSASEKTVEELRFDSIGPIIGQELKTKSLYSIIIVLIAIIAYIAYAFRKISQPVESWKYGVSAIIALIHDVLIVIGTFSFLGHFWGIQIDSYFVTAVLTVLGFSVHDTIVTFDRARENLPRHQDKTFEEVVNLSVNETIIRSINTSVTAMIVLACIFLFGGVTIKYFALALLIGFFIGTYSSIFLASPLLLLWYRLKKY